MRLKHLEMQGYKTFASRTEFDFDEGITAIVGPNGSGKSNVADAVRWVLGEQSYRILRGKRTEDMIFSGSAQRPRLGMASASLLLDNADGWLPIDFVEVTVTRRAYRSGENEYLLNGRRVRLRDITDLLAKSGLARRTYTVIGQGLVDAVLSLRPDDRRALFEEAAGISLYQKKRADAVSRLEETRSNLLRVNDIINEIAPRMRRLARESERAEHHALLSEQLDGLLRTWYGFRWREEQRGLRRTRDAQARREDSLRRQREALEALDEQVMALRARQAGLREQLGSWHRESGDLHRQMEEVQRDLAVWQERARQLSRQSDEQRAEVSELEVQIQATAERMAAAKRDIDEARAALHEREELVAQVQAELDTLEEKRGDLTRQLAEVQARVLELTTLAADRRNRLEQLDEQRAALLQEREKREGSIAELQDRVEELRQRIAATTSDGDRLVADRKALGSEASWLADELATVQNHKAEYQGQLAEAQRALERLATRYDLLTRLRQEGEGLRAGVRTVLQAANSAETPLARPLYGVLGTVAQLLHVPAKFEIAIEVALGSHLEDVVVESWTNAEAAIAYLRAGQRGRVTFLPLDTVRPVPRLHVQGRQGVIGVAADLVEADDDLGLVVEMLLGRAIVVEDLKAARGVFDQLEGGGMVVTLAGEILRSSGSVTGGQGRGEEQGHMLARSREWRELPAQIRAGRKRSRDVELRIGQAQAAEREVSDRADALQARVEQIEEALREAQTRQQELTRELVLVEQQQSWQREQVAQQEETVAKLGTTEELLRSELADLTAEKESKGVQLGTLQASLDKLQGEAIYQRLSEARTAAAVAQGSWEHRRDALDSLRGREAQLEVQVAARNSRVEALSQEQESLAGQIRDRSSRETVIQGWLTSLTEKIEPAETEVADLEAARERQVKEEGVLRTRLRGAENRHAQAVLAHSRQEDRLQRVRREIMDDFGLVEMEPTEGFPEQPPLPLGEMVSALPVVERLPEGLEEDIHQIKAQLRRMGSVNPNAPDEYAEVMDRYTFLTTQATDLDEAASSLREVIAELDEVMRTEFQATFKEIAAGFEANFTELFGGGTAYLELSDPEDISQTGVEIMARPPGKRQQTLALLSGGERALTAVALIFSILSVSPPPFCILDEVDATLDEANVRRFRKALATLSEKTQFIVITHNRGTIQAANTIYGVSMGDDSVSQVVSLQFDGEKIAAPDGTVVEAKAG